jgi:hypothetical protein
MTLIAAAQNDLTPPDGFTRFMMWSGGVAIALMALHLAWAIVVLLRNPTRKDEIPAPECRGLVVLADPVHHRAIGANLSP